MDRTNEIEQIASDWLIRRQSGRWTQIDETRFEQWLDASTLNRVAFLRLELAWEDAARLKALGAGISRDRPPPADHWNLTPFYDANPTGVDARRMPPATRKDRRRTWKAALAASVLAAAGLGGYLAWVPGGDRYATPVGGLAQVPVLDGSKITLNTDSQIRVSLTQSERRVDLKHGEAFFEVAKDPSRPFVVAAGRKRVVAVGTKFSVRRDGEAIEVVVTEGRVRIENAMRPAGEASGSPAPQDPDGQVLLTPGAIARVDEAGVLVQRKSLPEAEAHLSWRAGVLTFRDESLAAVAAEFNRYNVRKIVVDDPAAAALKVEGNFRATNVDAFVRLLESGFPIRVSAEEDRIVLSSR